jgi:hypothetical protein
MGTEKDDCKYKLKEYELRESFNDIYTIFYPIGNNLLIRNLLNNSYVTLTKIFNEEDNDFIRVMIGVMELFCRDNKWKFNLNQPTDGEISNVQNLLYNLVILNSKLDNLFNPMRHDINELLKNDFLTLQLIRERFEKTIALLNEAYKLYHYNGGRKKRRSSTRRRQSTRRRRQHRRKSAYSFSPPSSSQLSKLNNFFL